MSKETFYDNLVNLANAECMSMMDREESKVVAEQGSWYSYATEELGRRAMVNSVEISQTTEL